MKPTTMDQSRPAQETRNVPQGQAEALGRLHREMTALFGILPVPLVVPGDVLQSDAEIEAQFDNMPV
ncbi:MAG: hypothetical protein ACK4GW_10135 [Pseudorhodobacter sp.]